MNREYHRWHSSRLGRDMELLLFGQGGEPVVLLPTSRGRFYQNEDFGLIHAIADKLEAGRYLVVCPDSVDEESWFNRGVHPRERVARHKAYEAYLLEEVVPLVRGRSSGGRLTLGGCSFGGFHTYNIGLRHPDVFLRLLSMGGKFETDELLEGYHDQDVYFHSCHEWLPNLTDAGQLAALRRVDMVLAVGEHDFCRPSNERLSSCLWKKDLPHQLAVWNGAVHDWPVWRQMVAQYLPW